MLRWTQNHAEELHISTFADFVGDYATRPIDITLKNGVIVRGIFYAPSAGNTHGHAPYYAGFTLTTDQGDVEIDYLDVASATLTS
jgi:hypothetical protein